MTNKARFIKLVTQNKINLINQRKNLIIKKLTNSGFDKFYTFSDGQDGYEYRESMKKQNCIAVKLLLILPNKNKSILKTF